jgi:hypothetical protein
LKGIPALPAGKGASFEAGENTPLNAMTGITVVEIRTTARKTFVRFVNAGRCTAKTNGQLLDP